MYLNLEIRARFVPDRNNDNGFLLEFALMLEYIGPIERSSWDVMLKESDANEEKTMKRENGSMTMTGMKINRLNKSKEDVHDNWNNFWSTMDQLSESKENNSLSKESHEPGENVSSGRDDRHSHMDPNENFYWKNDAKELCFASSMDLQQGIDRFKQMLLSIDDIF